MDLAAAMQFMSLDGKETTDGCQNVHTFAVTIGEHKTDFLMGDFKNRLLLVASQYSRLGALIQVTPDQCPENTVYNVQVVFGSDDVQQQAAARHIAERLNIQKTLVLFLSLKSYDSDALRAVADAVLDQRSLLSETVGNNASVA